MQFVYSDLNFGVESNKTRANAVSTLSVFKGIFSWSQWEKKKNSYASIQRFGSYEIAIKKRGNGLEFWLPFPFHLEHYIGKNKKNYKQEQKKNININPFWSGFDWLEERNWGKENVDKESYR